MHECGHSFARDIMEFVGDLREMRNKNALITAVTPTKIGTKYTQSKAKPKIGDMGLAVEELLSNESCRFYGVIDESVPFKVNGVILYRLEGKIFKKHWIDEHDRFIKNLATSNHPSLADFHVTSYDVSTLAATNPEPLAKKPRASESHIQNEPSEDMNVDENVMPPVGKFSEKFGFVSRYVEGRKS